MLKTLDMLACNSNVQLVERFVDFSRGQIKGLWYGIDGFLDIGYLRESSIYAPLRALDDFPELATNIQRLVAVQRAKIPAEQLQPLISE